jgi:hypothetical protein
MRVAAGRRSGKSESLGRRRLACNKLSRGKSRVGDVRRGIDTIRIGDGNHLDGDSCAAWPNELVWANARVVVKPKSNPQWRAFGRKRAASVS